MHLRIALIIASLMFFGLVSAQRLVVNGSEVEGLSTTLVSGRSYVTADTFARAIGADYSFSPSDNLATLSYVGHLLSIQVFSSAAEATAQSEALRLNGTPAPGEGAVAVNGRVYIPVSSVARALGGSVTYLSSDQTVMVVFPRARVVSAELTGLSPNGRFVVSFSGLSPFETYYNRALNTVQIRFSRVDLAEARTFQGAAFTNAILTPNAGFVDFRLTLREGYSFESFVAPTSDGFELVVDILRADSRDAAQPGRNDARRIVIDPGHGGSDSGMVLSAGTEGELTLRLASELERALRARGYTVELTRTQDIGVPVSQRAQQGIGATLFISLHAADLPAGQFTVYYLGEAEADMVMALAIRDNAEAAVQTTTDALRRRILLGLVPDLAKGESYARALVTTMNQLAGYRGTAVAAPLRVLEGAAGRGILLELSSSDLTSGSLAETLASALVSVLATGGD
jgi:N-acetylmuramoyl-L-alanine amidase